MSYGIAWDWENSSSHIFQSGSSPHPLIFQIVFVSLHQRRIASWSEWWKRYFITREGDLYKSIAWNKANQNHYFDTIPNRMRSFWKLIHRNTKERDFFTNRMEYIFPQSDATLTHEQK